MQMKQVLKRLSWILVKIKSKTIIKVIDDGHGFTNLENLFVLFFLPDKMGKGLV